MKAVRICLCVLAGVMLLAQCAFCAAVWTQQRITNTSWSENSPKIWGDTVYYNDRRSGSNDIYRWDPMNGSVPIITDPGSQNVQCVYDKYNCLH